MTAPANIRALRDRLKNWLFDHALPLWWEVGADRARGGFFERISLDGEAVEAPRRARVVARQAYVYAMAGALGWSGPWREAVEHAMTALLGPFAREDGLFRILVSPDGAPLDERPDPYEQAFALLAMASAQRALGRDFEDRALRTLTGLRALLVDADGGVHDDGDRGPPLRANPMMHLFEALQAWGGVGADAGWRGLADAVAGTALTRMIAPETGALCELFAVDWRALPEADVEPGHQFEWGWLLLAHTSGNCPQARRLIDIGETRGVDQGVAVFSLDQTLAVRDRSARLWAQTERLHAHAVAGNWNGVQAAAEGLWRFLDVPKQGLWRDRLLPDGTFVEEAAPASSLYHVVSAVAALDAATG